MNFLPPEGALRNLVKSGQSKLITVTTFCDENANNRPPRLIINYSNNDHWASCLDSTFTAYIQIELKGLAINIHNYSYETLNPSRWRSRNWEFIGSNNGRDWKMIDEHENDDILKDNQITLLPAIHGSYRFFRLRQTGHSYYDGVPTTEKITTKLYVRNIDLFGYVYTLRACSIRVNTFRSRIPLMIMICYSSI